MTARRATSPREWALAIAGGLALAALLVWVLRGDQTVDPPPAPVPATASPAPVPPPAPPPIATASAPADLKLAGLRVGPDGGMAIVLAGGRQYLLRPGRSLPGGLSLLRVEPGRAILAGPAGEVALGFADAAPAAASAAPPGGDPTPWRLALSPVRQGGAVAGWRVDSLAGLPMLARAGVKTGDILLAANGADLISEEKIMELPQELASNGQLRLALRRGSDTRDVVVQP